MFLTISETKGYTLASKNVFLVRIVFSQAK